MPVITVELFPGRTPDTKRELIKALTETYVNVCGGTPQSVTLLLKEIDPIGDSTYRVSNLHCRIAYS